MIDFQVFAANVTERDPSPANTVTMPGRCPRSTDYLDPSAWFEVIIREKNSGVVVLQDGFGQTKQYGSERSRHLKLLTTGNYLIEFGGN